MVGRIGVERVEEKCAERYVEKFEGRGFVGCRKPSWAWRLVRALLGKEWMVVDRYFGRLAWMVGGCRFGRLARMVGGCRFDRSAWMVDGCCFGR